MLARRLPQVTSSNAHTVCVCDRRMRAISGTTDPNPLWRCSNGISVNWSPFSRFDLRISPQMAATKKSGTLLATGMPRRTACPHRINLSSTYPRARVCPPELPPPGREQRKVCAPCAWSCKVCTSQGLETNVVRVRAESGPPFSRHTARWPQCQQGCLQEHVLGAGENFALLAFSSLRLLHRRSSHMRVHTQIQPFPGLSTQILSHPTAIKYGVKCCCAA